MRGRCPGPASGSAPWPGRPGVGGQRPLARSGRRVAGLEAREPSPAPTRHRPTGVVGLAAAVGARLLLACWVGAVLAVAGRLPGAVAGRRTRRAVAPARCAARLAAVLGGILAVGPIGAPSASPARPGHARRAAPSAAAAAPAHARTIGRLGRDGRDPPPPGPRRPPGRPTPCRLRAWTRPAPPAGHDGPGDVGLVSTAGDARTPTSTSRSSSAAATRCGRSPRATSGRDATAAEIARDLAALVRREPSSHRRRP